MTHPLRLAYARTLQAILAIEIVRFDVDDALGGDPRWLNDITEHLTDALQAIQRLAAAERINLGDEDEEESRRDGEDAQSRKGTGV